MSIFKYSFIILTFFLTLTTYAEVSQNEPIYKWPIDIVQISTDSRLSRHVFIVDKSERKLFVYALDGTKLIQKEEVASDIGKNDGDKKRRDDHRTPEGIYFLETQTGPPQIPFDLYGDLAFTTNYPNFFDKRDKKTGSGIWLHAIPDTVPLTRGSRGCVVVRNDMIKKLKSYIELRKTPLVILDDIRYVSAEEHKVNKDKILNFLENWRQAWQTQKIDNYIGFYDVSFTTPGFDYNSWKAHKEKLTEKYDYIKVEILNPMILTHKNQLFVQFVQKYESNQHQDEGIKTIYAIKDQDTFRIIREDWEKR